jgi:indole-3-glycerol phosphate synthase
MSAFLSKILETKRQEVASLQHERNALESNLQELPDCRGFAQSIASASGISVVAEIKKASPSKGLITPDFQPEQTAACYERAGACAVSVLTDQQYFQGSIDVLRQVRSVIEVPVLRKDFIIDELQILEARQAGADAVLLICAALSDERVLELSRFARTLSLDVLLEVHDMDELDIALQAKPSVLGVNNRNLHTFEVSLHTTETILREVPDYVLAIAESGVHTPKDALRMKRAGAKGILVGESLMRAESTEAVDEMVRGFRFAGVLHPNVNHAVETV